MKRVGEGMEEIPEDREALDAERARLASRAADLIAEMGRMGKADPKRALLIDEKMVLDRRLSRVNKALRAANRAAMTDHAAPDADDSTERAEQARVENDERVLEVARAILSGPLASRFWDEASGSIDAETLCDEAWDVVNRVRE